MELEQYPATNFIDLLRVSTRRVCGHVDVGTCPHQVLAATLTLSQPGGQIMPTLYWCPHQVLKATAAPANLIFLIKFILN